MPGLPWIAYVRAALLAGDAPSPTLTDSTYQLKCSVGTLKLPRTPASLTAPRLPLQLKNGLQISVETLATLLNMLNANYVSALQVAYPEMLGIVISSQGAYSVSLQALLKLRIPTPPTLALPVTPQLLPEPFLRLVETALAGYGGNAPIVFHSTPSMVWTTISRTTIGTALPDVDKWLDLTKVTEQCEDPSAQSLDVSLNALRDKQTLLTLANATHLELSPEGARVVSAGMEYTWEEVHTPTPLRLPFDKTMKILTLAATLKRSSPRLVHLEGPEVEAFVSTRE